MGKLRFTRKRKPSKKEAAKGEPSKRKKQKVTSGEEESSGIGSRRESQERGSRGGSGDTGTQQGLTIEKIPDSSRNEPLHERNSTEENRNETDVLSEEQHSVNEEERSAAQRDLMIIDAETTQPSTDRKSTRLNSSHSGESRMPSSA